MIHVITPFSRPQNIETLVNHLRDFNIIWYPLPHEDIDFPKEEWIQPFKIVPPDDWKYAPCYYKLNKFIDNGIIDTDYYCVLCDDDLYEVDFFDKIRKHTGDIIIPSMLHGYNSDLIARPGKMRPQHVGFEQLLIKGFIFKKYRYNNSREADGELIEKIYKDMPEAFDFASECFVLFNQL